jgi:uncharacterized protein YhbP (UPF0306 family)
MPLKSARLEKIADLLRSQSSLALSTAPGGEPRSTPLFYLADDDLRLYWFSSASSEHSRTLRRDPEAAVAVYRPTDEWRKIQGVQMRGRVSAISDRERRRAIGEAYCERFGLGRFFKNAMSRSRLYVFEPDWVRYIDNTKRFGYRFEIQLPRS